MKVEWLHEAQLEFKELLHYHRVTVGPESARRFSRRILDAVMQLEQFPEMGVRKEERLLGKYDFRALFIGNYACIYRIEDGKVYVYHLADARTNYLYQMFGLDPLEDA